MAQKPLDLSSGMKTCPQCEQTKPVGEFYKSKGTMHGYAVYCKKCSYERHKVYTSSTPAYRAKAAKRAREWRKKNPERQRDLERRSHYGMEPGTYAAMLVSQEGKCALCGTSDPKGKGTFHVDHCHIKGHVRALLCYHCNVGIGHFNHDPELLQKAISYLNRMLR